MKVRFCHLEFGCYDKHTKHALFQPPYLEGIDLDIFIQEVLKIVPFDHPKGTRVFLN